MNFGSDDLRRPCAEGCRRLVIYLSCDETGRVLLRVVSDYVETVFICW